MTTSNAVAVVIPTRNAGPGLTQLLDGLAAQEGFAAAPIVAIDSGSSDGTVELLASRGAQVLSVEPGQFNHGETRNLAMRIAISPNRSPLRASSSASSGSAYPVGWCLPRRRTARGPNSQNPDVGSVMRVPVKAERQRASAAWLTRSGECQRSGRPR